MYKRQVLDFAAEHRETCAVLFNSSEASGFIQALQQLICQGSEPLVKTWFRPQDERLTDYLLNFLAWGLIGLLKEWFDQDMALARDELMASAQCMVEGAAVSLFPRN